MLYLSMDCEALLSKKFKGPKTLVESENSIRNFAIILDKYEIEGEFFITPEAAKNHSQLFTELGKKHKLSLHLHLGSHKNGHYFGQKIELGNLSKQKQQSEIKLALDEFTHALNQKPHGFRAGMASANCDTFEVLTKLGIHHGSLTIPNLTSERYKFDWKDWPQIPHTIETAFGPFTNFPLTNDFKIESNNSADLTEKIIASYKALDYASIYTHNWVDFSDSFYLEALLKQVKSV